MRAVFGAYPLRGPAGHRSRHGTLRRLWPDPQVARFAVGELPDPAEVEAIAGRARQLFAAALTVVAQRWSERSGAEGGHGVTGEELEAVLGQVTAFGWKMSTRS